MPAHAKLSPSAAERWVECPASIRMEDHLLDLGIQEVESSYALEGTVAHKLADLKGSLAFGFITVHEFHVKRKKWATKYSAIIEEGNVELEMEDHTDSYVELIKERALLYPMSQVFFEQRLPTGMPDGGSGTSDCVIVSPTHVEIVDFKYGQGVTVEAEDNPQLKLYAGGALDTYGDILGDTELVLMTVHQPRLNHVLTAEMTPEALREWRSGVYDIGVVALGPDAPFGPSEAACRWCPASGRCQAQLEAVFSEPFEIPEMLTGEQVGDTLPRLKQIRDWLSAFEDAALHMAYSEGKAIPGYKVVLSGGKRSFADPDGAVEFLLKEGYDFEEVARRSPRTLGDLEKLLGVKEMAELLAPFIKPPTGKPSLVLESDSRPAVAPNTEAAKDFAAADEEDVLS